MNLNFLVGSVLILCIAAENGFTADPEFSQWQYFSDVGQRGTPLCGIQTGSKSQNVIRSIAVKASSDALVVDLYKDKWVRRSGETVRVAFDFADNQPLVLSAYADGHILDVRIPEENLSVFLLEIAQRPAMQVVLPDEEREMSWFIGNRGARDAVQRMISCMKKLG